MAYQQAAQDHGGRAGQQGQDPGDSHAPGGADHLGRQRGGSQQQGESRRLREHEVAVRQCALRQAQRAGEINAVVVPGDAEQHAGPRDLVDPQAQGQQRGRDDDGADRRAGEDAQLRAGRRGVLRRPGRRRHLGCAHRWPTSAGFGPGPLRIKVMRGTPRRPPHDQFQAPPYRSPANPMRRGSTDTPVSLRLRHGGELVRVAHRSSAVTAGPPRAAKPPLARPPPAPPPVAWPRATRRSPSCR